MVGGMLTVRDTVAVPLPFVFVAVTVYVVAVN